MMIYLIKHTDGLACAHNVKAFLISGKVCFSSSMYINQFISWFVTDTSLVIMVFFQPRYMGKKKP